MTQTVHAIRHVVHEDLGIFEPYLLAAGFEITYFEAGIDILPEAEESDLLVVLGGPIGVYDEPDFPFLTQEKELIKARLDSKKPLLGICLGAQLIASVAGARVEATGKKEIGYGALELTEAGKKTPLSRPASMPVLHWHGDQFTIPAGADSLAQTEGFPYQAFTLKNGDIPFALALQFHLEADFRRIEHWLISNIDELTQTDLNIARVRQDAAEYGPALEQAGLAVLDDWLKNVELVKPRV